jgi:hypothetical protein
MSIPAQTQTSPYHQKLKQAQTKENDDDEN